MKYIYIQDPDGHLIEVFDREEKQGEWTARNWHSALLISHFFEMCLKPLKNTCGRLVSGRRLGPVILRKGTQLKISLRNCQYFQKKF